MNVFREPTATGTFTGLSAQPLIATARVRTAGVGAEDFADAEAPEPLELVLVEIVRMP